MLAPTRTSVRLVRLLIALTGLTAIAVNLVHARTEGTDFHVSNYFSYFTNLSNIAAALVLLAGALVLPRRPWFDTVRGAASFSMVVTGLIYAVLLSGLSLGVTAPWINDVLHRIVPVVLLVDWLVVRRNRPGASPWVALWWLVVPVAYLGYTLVRGPLAADWYPYPFLDPTRSGGYPRVGLTCVVLAVGMAALALALAWGARLLDRLSDRREP